MKRPLSVVIISKDPHTLQELHVRYDAQTRFPRWKLVSILFKALFTGHF